MAIAIFGSLCAGWVAASPATADGAPRWGGFYVGAGIGAIGLSGDERDRHTVPPHTDKTSGDRGWGVLGSVGAGYDFHLSKDIIAGAFTEFDFTNADFNVHTSGGDTNSLEQNNAFNVGGRIGFLAAPSTLVFGEGGYSRGKFDFDYADEYSTNKSFDGWFVGVGAEQKITEALSIKLGYRFTQYDEEKVGVIAPPPPAVDQEEHFIDADSHSIRLGLNYNLGIGQ